jgi:hypothetical protein
VGVRLGFPLESAVFGFEVDVAAALDAGSGASAVFAGAATSGVGAGVTLAALAALAGEAGASIGFSGLAAAPGASDGFEEPLPIRTMVSVPTTRVNATAAVRRIGTFWFFGRSGEGYPADVCEKPAAVDAPAGGNGVIGVIGVAMGGGAP